MSLTNCYCTTNQQDCDPNTHQVACKPGQNFCFLSLRQTDNSTKIPYIQGCWYEHSIDDSLLEPDICYNISSNSGYVSCFCKGDFCNVPSIEIQPRLDVSITSTDNHNQTFDGPISTIRENPFASFSKNPTLFYAISLPLLLLILLIFTFIFLLCRRYRNSANALGGSAIGDCGGSSKPKSYFSCQNFFPTLKLCFTLNKSPGDDGQFDASGGVICRFCPLNSTPCSSCGKGFMNSIDGVSSMPQLVHPILGGGWLAEGEIEGLSKICTKVKRCSRGRFGEVWLGHMTKVDGDDNGDNAELKHRQVAIKVFPEAERKSWETELELYRLPRLKHSNILHFIGIDKVTRDPSEEREGHDRSSCSGTSECGPLTEYWLVTDYLAHGSVYDYIHSNELSWGEMLWIAMGMARGLSYLHTELPCTATQYPKPSIAHRDFKSRNVLLKADLTPCISDLGLATRLETGRGFGDAHLQVGTARYMAPEVLDGAIQFTRDAFLRIDVYALGLVIWELMTRAHRPGDPMEGDEGAIPIPPYMAPFEAELGPNPSMDKLQHYVAKMRNRPQPNPRWANDQGFLQLWETVQDSWDHDAEARITAGCIAGRIHNLSQRYPPSSDDPAHSLLFLAAPSSLISTSGESTTVTAASSLEVPGSCSASSPPSSSTFAQNLEAVPLLLAPNSPNERSTCGPSIEMV